MGFGKQDFVSTTFILGHVESHSSAAPGQHLETHADSAA